MHLSPHQVDKLDELRSLCREAEQRRRAINSIIASTKLPIRPLFQPFLGALTNDVERAFLDHELTETQRLAAA